MKTDDNDLAGGGETHFETEVTETRKCSRCLWKSSERPPKSSYHSLWDMVGNENPGNSAIDISFTAVSRTNVGRYLYRTPFRGASVWYASYMLCYRCVYRSFLTRSLEFLLWSQIFRNHVFKNATFWQAKFNLEHSIIDWTPFPSSLETFRSVKPEFCVRTFTCVHACLSSSYHLTLIDPGLAVVKITGYW